MKLNTDKCHLLISEHKYEHMICSIDNTKVIESHIVTFLGIDIDSELTFSHHINSICKKASSKLNALNVSMCQSSTLQMQNADASHF